MIEHMQFLVDVGTVSDAVPVDVLPALTHWPYNNLVLIALGRWSLERASQPSNFEFVILYKKSSKEN
jgi:hypothetical protein